MCRERKRTAARCGVDEVRNRVKIPAFLKFLEPQFQERDYKTRLPQIGWPLHKARLRGTRTGR